jgi:DNA-directed RNA polymerase subunit RPC12/RpoP
MSIPIRCPSCQHIGEVPDDYAGWHIRCPKCRGKFLVPTQPSTAPAMQQETPAEKLVRVLDLLSELSADERQVVRNELDRLDQHGRN